MTSRMFPFITKTWNPIAGGYVDKEGEMAACSHLCKYCWARGLINKHKWKKYQGPHRVHEAVMNLKFRPDDFVFVCDMIDIGDVNIPDHVIIQVLEKISDYLETDFLLLTKNPDFYKKYRYLIPKNAVIGATVETNTDLAGEYSFAPLPAMRLKAMNWCKENLKNRRFISVEPIMKFNHHFFGLIVRLEPWGVAVGYDNYNNGLEEPTLQETNDLIDVLENAEITVYRKTIREARQ